MTVTQQRTSIHLYSSQCYRGAAATTATADGNTGSGSAMTFTHTPCLTRTGVVYDCPLQ